MDQQRPKTNQANKFDNTHIFVAQPAANPNAMPEILELGTFPQSSNTPMPPGFLPNVNVPPPAYSQSINAAPLQVQAANVHVVVSLQLGPFPASIQCPFCHVHIITKVIHRAGLLAWLICCGLAFIGCWPCCLCPFVLKGCQDVVHICPSCNAFVSKYRRI